VVELESCDGFSYGWGCPTSFNQLLAINLGFAKENVLTLQLGLPSSKYSGPQTINFHRDLISRLKTLPSVQSVGTINHIPFNGFGIVVHTGIEGNPAPKRKDPAIGVGSVSTDYFRTMKIPLISGRVYDERDSADSAKVAIVNQAFAQKYFDGAEAIGKHVGFGCKDGLCRTIVGVVGNVRQESLTGDATPEMFVPFGQMPLNGMTVLIRSSGDPLNLVSAVRNEVVAIDPNQPIYGVKSLEQRVAESVAVTRALMFLFSAFAILALVLASVGIYGIVSYSVSQRTHEIGIRMALGASQSDVLRLIMRNGLTLAFAGVVLGIGGAVALTRFMTVLLFGVKPTDPKTFIFVAVGLLLIALLACLIPARRATKVDPLVALRYE
jgi:putative ABC transport system permease protein